LALSQNGPDGALLVGVGSVRQVRAFVFDYEDEAIGQFGHEAVRVPSLIALAAIPRRGAPLQALPATIR